jgi:hypothetical protein
MPVETEKQAAVEDEMKEAKTSEMDAKNESKLN